jgi:hypothetical protein
MHNVRVFHSYNGEVLNDLVTMMVELMVDDSFNILVVQKDPSLAYPLFLILFEHACSLEIRF